MTKSWEKRRKKVQIEVDCRTTFTRSATNTEAALL